MSLYYSEISRFFARRSAAELPAILKTPSLPEKTGIRRYLGRLWDNTIFPAYFKFYRGPQDRWMHASMTKYLRDHGLMYDDLYSDKEPVIERALQLLPEDIATARYRRLMRGTHLNFLRLYLPVSEQNYDPFIPYLAPYIEEAKFQLQEEEELLGFHMWDRRLYSGATTGFGDVDLGCHFLLAIPNLYGPGGGIRKHLHTQAHAGKGTRSP